MPTPAAAAGYARISSDLDGSGLGVARQVEDCQRLAATLGWAVADTYVDHADRLTRRPVELEEFVGVLDVAKVRYVRFVVGDMDLGTGDGLMVAALLVPDYGTTSARTSATSPGRARRPREAPAAAPRPGTPRR